MYVVGSLCADRQPIELWRPRAPNTQDEDNWTIEQTLTKHNICEKVAPRPLEYLGWPIYRVYVLLPK